jgi:hypothetical protein
MKYSEVNMRTVVCFLSFLFLLSISACSQGNVNACVPTCDGKQCGDDQCGGTCQPGCGEGETCNTGGQCVPAETDTTPPYPITDLTASNSTEGSITLTWTAPGDDLATGTASEYDIRYSTASITEANWASATEVSNEPAPQISGTSQTHVVSSLSPDTTYYFAIKTTDDADNVSALSNIASGKTLADSGVFQFYPSDFYWNVPVDKMPVDSKSQAYTDTMVKYNEYLYGWVNAVINVVDGSTPRKLLTFRLWDVWNLYQFGDTDILYPIPPAADCAGVAEGENIYYMLDPSTNELWEMYDGRLNRKCVNDALIDSPGDMCACYANRFDLNSYALRPFGYTSCSVSGLDPAPGMVRKAEIEAGVIRHALGVALYHMHDSYVWPSSRGGTHPNPVGDTYPPDGQRFRLKASFDISGYTRDQQVVLTALKKYGFLAMENSNQHTISMNFEKGITGFGSATFRNIRGSDFEAVDCSSMMISVDSGQCKPVW